MRGVILCAGLGSRLRPLTHTGAKHLIPIAGKPILHYGIENLVGAGIEDIVLVTSSSTRAQLREAVGTGEQFGARISLVEQERPLGLADAIASAREFVADEDFVVYLGDNIIHGGVADFVRAFDSEVAAQVLVAEVDNPERFGVVVLDGDRVLRLVEKPKEFVSNFAIVGIYGFRPAIFDAIGSISPSARGELEITDAIELLVESGARVRAHRLTDWWADTGHPEDVIEANRMMLLELARDVCGEVDEESEVTGNVRIGRGSTVRRSVLRGPVWIGDDCRLDGVYVGPYTSVGDGCQLASMEIEHSIVLPGCSITDVATRIGSSLIGNRVTITRRHGPPQALQLVIGDESTLKLT